MSLEKIFNFTVDKDNLIVKEERSFDAPLDLGWSAWNHPGVIPVPNDPM